MFQFSISYKIISHQTKKNTSVLQAKKLKMSIKSVKMKYSKTEIIPFLDMS